MNETNLPSALPSHFLRQIIEADLKADHCAHRRWGGSPGDAQHHAQGQTDPAPIRTRFPPEPNGYLHIGHAKSICLNFGLARDYGGVCHLRLDDTNPGKENPVFAQSILDAVQWLGFAWEGEGGTHLYHASDYFEFMFRAACSLIENGDAYVDEQSPEEIRAGRGDFTQAGHNSPFRARSAAENLVRFQEMQAGQHPDGAMVLRAKVDMAHPNLNLRDPTLYRIRHTAHPRTGQRWCIYPMYTFAHPIEDALENITHSICTLEFEDQRPFYDWLLDKLAKAGLVNTPVPRQYEFARLNLTYTLTSKRKLGQLVEEGHVQGWDDPRLPTLLGLRRRGYTPEAIALFCERMGVSKAESWIDHTTLEGALRDSLDPQAPRAMVVLDPLKLVITNWEEVFGQQERTEGTAPVHPHRPELGQRRFGFSKTVWVERSDFEESPSKGFFRLFPGNKVRLKYAYVVECTGAVKDAQGKIQAVHAKVIPDTQSGTPGADAVKVKGTITWVSAAEGLPAEVRLYEALFTVPQPGAGQVDFLKEINPESCKVFTAYAEPGLAKAAPEERFQFERQGYFVADRLDHHAPERLVFNRIVKLKGAWEKSKQQ